MDNNDYDSHCQRLIDQYYTTVDNLENYPGVDFFVDKYNLKHCKNAITRIKQKQPNTMQDRVDIENSKRAFKFGQEVVELIDFLDLGDVAIQDVSKFTFSFCRKCRV